VLLDGGVLEVIRLMDDLPARGVAVVYLAGPVPRDPAKRCWHDDAVFELRAAGLDGTVIDPTPRGSWPPDPDVQIDWEMAAMERADALLFWVPRKLWELPGLTTNLEWGVWHRSGKAVLAAPPDAPKMRYLQRYAERAGAAQAHSLPEAARIAVQLASIAR
jgi:nucleoside 2-deoxyribosyltransferase